MYSLKQVEEVYSNYTTLPFSLFFLRKKAINKLDLKPGQKVLDVACGSGSNFKHIEQQIGKKGHILAIDYTENMIKKAKKHAKKNHWHNIEFLQKDLAKADLPCDHFDGIISTIGFCSIPDHKNALKNTLWSLKKRGKLVMLEGKPFNLKPLNLLMPLIRWNKSWDKDKPLIEDTKELFPNKPITIEEYKLGSNFILEIRK